MRKTRKLLFGALVAASLGFGGAQAVAAPSAAAEPKALRCTQDACERKCQTQFGVSGFCTGRGCWCMTG